MPARNTSFPVYHVKIALGYFLVAAILGGILRLFHWQPLPITYKFMVHTHSHIALLGWVYMALTLLICRSVLQEALPAKWYRLLFWGTQGCLLGMLFSFPFQGYALVSIIFSTLFLLVSYAFAGAFLFFCPAEVRRLYSYRYLRVALWYMVLSSLGPWALGIIMNTLGPASPWYRNAVYFYLHFQYNGWMLMALLGLFFHVAEQRRLVFEGWQYLWVYRFLNAGILLSFFLSILWNNPPAYAYLLAGLGAGLQALAFGLLFVLCYSHSARLRGIFSRLQWRLLVFTALLLAIKVLLQLLTAFPYFADLAARIPELVIGYLHGTFLGVVSLWLFVLLDYYNLVRIPRYALGVYLLGFALTEILIFYKGVAAWQGLLPFEEYHKVLALAGLLIPLALTGWFFRKKVSRAGGPSSDRVQ